MCEQTLKKKKKTAPQYNSNSLNCKNQEKANNSLSYRCAAIKKDTHVYNNCYELRSRAINGRFVVIAATFFESITTAF